MSSLVGKMQVEQANTGAVQTNLTIPVIESLQIICPPPKIQNKFVQKVHQSYTLKDESKDLLETAKHVVELAIEQS
ncbi:MAG: hypothetical protein VSS75_033000 [Candidatus Parabeggiatoa sp.]|nr:hypothetical protein BGS_0658 [Beggiatoa sp. SS]MEC4585196.1 hypothetical protein [Candidatus Parabeggiatoa sp.]